MKTLFLDLETRCAVPIRDGVYRYAEHAEILLSAWAVNDGPVTVADGTPDEFLAEIAAADRIVAHNAQFDRVILDAAGIETDLKKWFCTKAAAYAHSLPGSLDALCTLFGVPTADAKMTADGKKLVRLFCLLDGKGKHGTKESHPDEWARFCEYAAADVRALRSVYKAMPPWNYQGEHLALWHLDQTINDRGILVDAEFSRAALDVMARQKEALDEKLSEQTEGAVEGASQRDAVLTLLRERGVMLPDLRKETITRALEDDSLPADVRAILEIRAEAAQIAGMKHRALLAAMSADGRVRGTLVFCGAGRTGRWSGQIVQPQNLPRPPKYLEGDEFDRAIEAIKRRDLSAYPRPLEVISGTVRGAFVAAPGKKLLVADLSAIEARVLAWVAGEKAVLDAFRAGTDIYKAAYSLSFGIPVEDVTAEQRRIGKVQVLALGYQGAVSAVRRMAGDAAADWSDDWIVQNIIRPWRQANKRIVRLWYAVEEMAKAAVRNPGRVYAVGKLKAQCELNWLRIRLPSGRYLCYPKPAVDQDGVLWYYGINQFSRKWSRHATYGGKLVENITQAVARDVMAHGMQEAEARGLPVVLSVHDELVCEADACYTVGDLVAAMTTPPAWAPDLPLAASGFETTRYRKD